ncbi:actinorhodin polyketide synthase acyl carrier protein [Amycolatopsis sp. MJM2582]|uniref:acyl carrier protein n=1 Tax=Amycolatopsis TaxID=1813 RepID=UPI0005061150|nr:MULTISPECIES: acyl carrier protein [unclassified Amycolatopsis]KFZ76900.1 actinorhodin polyketide synthase acyl carrier protein [Amycolatopsis sp. MJM2582]RSN39556.1 acyl carrier protein [Amycolatopsis sp. WAC 04197]
MTDERVKLTLDDLTRVMRECAGADESVDLTGDIAGVEFADLGYDSLALLETTARLRQEYGIRLDDDVVANVKNAGELLAVINDVATAQA